MPIVVPSMWPYGMNILGDGPSTPRLRAISVVLAAHAGMQKIVRQFRTQHLETLLTADQVDMWLKTRPESNRPPALWLCNIPLERLVRIEDGSYIVPRHIMEEAEHSQNDKKRASLWTRTLDYATPEDPHTREQIRAVDGILDTLDTIAEGLVDFHAALWYPRLWQKEQAVTFVLTGDAPLVPEDAFPLPGRSGRRQTEKHLQLAAFTASMNALDVPPVRRLALWNISFPQWAYKNTTNHGWDSREALRRLMQGRDDRVEYDLDIAPADNRPEQEHLFNTYVARSLGATTPATQQTASLLGALYEMDDSPPTLEEAAAATQRHLLEQAEMLKAKSRQRKPKAQ